MKRLEDEQTKVTRIAESTLLENDNICQVHYDLFVEDKAEKQIYEIKEIHSMRYYFISDIKQMAEECGFELIDSFEFMTGRKLGIQTWGSCFILRSI